MCMNILIIQKKKNFQMIIQKSKSKNMNFFYNKNKKYTKEIKKLRHLKMKMNKIFQKLKSIMILTKSQKIYQIQEKI